jgi:hypothetical protein
VTTGSLCDRCTGSGWNNGGLCPHCFSTGEFTSEERRATLRQAIQGSTLSFEQACAALRLAHTAALEAEATLQAVAQIVAAGSDGLRMMAAAMETEK